MPFTRRLLILLAILGLVGLPAVALRVLCVGNSCSDTSQATARVPFCPLPDAIAPSLADILRYTRPNPTVRSGVAVPNIVGGPAPRLVLEVAWKGIGSQ